MPRRNAQYMETQRRAIVDAAVETMLEKGYTKTSIRDICKTAGISMGALYVHFTNKHELMLAAFRVSRALVDSNREIRTWKDYMEEMDTMQEGVRDERTLRRTRLALQYVAEIMLDGECPPGLGQWFEELNGEFTTALRTIRDNGEITLPLGLERTGYIHACLANGTFYNMFANKDADRVALLDGMKAAMAMTAGVVARQNTILRRAG